MVTGSSATLIGRQRELGALVASLDAVADGNGQLFLLEGEPGIGKTHLARALGEEAGRREFAVVLGTLLGRRRSTGVLAVDAGAARRSARRVPSTHLLGGDVARSAGSTPIVPEISAHAAAGEDERATTRLRDSSPSSTP